MLPAVVLPVVHRSGWVKLSVKITSFKPDSDPGLVKVDVGVALRKFVGVGVKGNQMTVAVGVEVNAGCVLVGIGGTGGAGARQAVRHPTQSSANILRCFSMYLVYYNFTDDVLKLDGHILC